MTCSRNTDDTLHPGPARDALEDRIARLEHMVHQRDAAIRKLARAVRVLARRIKVLETDDSDQDDEDLVPIMSIEQLVRSIRRVEGGPAG